MFKHSLKHLKNKICKLMPKLTFTDQNFETEVLKSDVPVLVDFWAPWCGPCKLQGPIVEELANDYQGQAVKIGKINVDENQEVSGRYQIMSIPTLAIFKNGQMVQQMIGLHDKTALSQKLEEAMK